MSYCSFFILLKDKKVFEFMGIIFPEYLSFQGRKVNYFCFFGRDYPSYIFRRKNKRQDLQHHFQE